MLRPRLIPCLLVHQGGLVKTLNFRNPKYVGDPINAVRIFNEKEADELIVLDIDASISKSPPDVSLITKLAAECRMPLCYGGGVATADQAERIIDLGIEKVSISSAAITNPSLLTKIAGIVGRQSVVAVLDIQKRKGLFSQGYEICTHNARKSYKFDPISLATELQDAGAGEIVINFVDRDGLMQGYDLEMAAQFKEKLRVPLTFLGGAGTLYDVAELIKHVGVVGAAAGSLFVFKGKYRAVLINYPTPDQKKDLFRKAMIS
jgi:imidazole glycerol-phosphate synthase subunit HisF